MHDSSHTQDHHTTRGLASLVLLLSLSLLLGACSTSKKATKTKVPKAEVTTPVPGKSVLPARVLQVLQNIRANELAFTELTGKMKTKANWDGRAQSFNTQLRWKKGQKMWLSMSVIGIEGARVLLNKDSVKIADRLGQRHILKPISYIEQKAHADLSFADIEKFFLGQLFLVDTAHLDVTESADQILLKSNGPRFLSVVTLDKQYRILNVNITDLQQQQSIRADYGNYQSVGAKTFPMDRYLKIVSGTSIFELDAKFQSVDITKTLSYPFDINPNYKIE